MQSQTSHWQKNKKAEKAGITAKTRWVTASLNFKKQKKNIPFAYRRVLTHQSTLRDVFSAEQIILHELAFMVSIKDKKERTPTQSNIINIVNNMLTPWMKTLNPPFRGGCQLQKCLWRRSTLRVPSSSSNHCSLASFSSLVRRLTITNECKSMHASDWLLCGVINKQPFIQLIWGL